MYKTLVGVCCFVAVVCFAQNKVSMVELLGDGRGEEAIVNLERILADNPSNRGTKLTLSLLYSLSCRLDYSLSNKDRDARKNLAIEYA